MLKTPARVLAKRYRVEFDPVLEGALEARYNIPPGTGALAVWDDRDAGRRKVDLLHWGLVPAWAREVNIGQRLSNARAESAATKPAFRDALRYRRCVVLADGFFEWKRSGRDVQPYYFFSPDGAPLSLAGLWEHWMGPDGSEILSVALLTTAANATMAPIHDRMPVLIEAPALDRWLAPGLTAAAAVADLLRPAREEALRCHPVSAAVNAVRHDGPELLLPVDRPMPPTGPVQGELF